MKKAIDTMQKIQIAIGGVFLLIFLVTVVIQMACRYMGVAAMWTEDVSMYSFIWAVFTARARWSTPRRTSPSPPSAIP